MPAVKPLAAVILAAGQSRRFNGNKLSHEINIDGRLKPLLLHTVDNWLLVFDVLYLTLPANDNTLYLLINDLPADQRDKILIVPVDKSELGMSQSLKAGILASQNAEAWLIGLADMPWVKASVLTDLQKRMKNGAQIAAPYYQGQRGQPVAFKNEYQYALMTIAGDKGAREVLRRHGADIVTVISPDDGILRDIDTPADLN